MIKGLDLDREQEHLREEFLPSIRRIAAAAQAFPQQMREQWQALCEAGFAGRAEEVHAERETLANRFATRLRFAEHIQHMAEEVTALTGEDIPESKALPIVIAELERLRDEILTSWRSLEDLEDMLAARFPLSSERLEALAQRYPPSPAWYEQEGKPF